MTVYSINQRIFEQTNMSASNGKSASSASDEFLAALSQAGSRVGAGAAGVPAAEKALKKVFDRQNDETRPQTKTVDKPKRAEAKETERSDKVDNTRTEVKTDETEVKTATDSADAAPQDDGDQQAQPKAEATTETVAEEAKPQVTADANAGTQTEAVVIAAPVQPQTTQVADTTTEAGGTQVVEQNGGEKIADDANKAGQNQADPQNAGAQNADGEVETVDVNAAAAGQNAAKAKSAQQHGDKNAAAQAQADALAASIDDTGAQVNVQVKVSEANRPVQPSVGTAEVLLTQDVDGIEVPLPGQGNGGQTGSQPQANSGQTAQNAATGAQDPALLNKVAETRPLVAALAAAQAEAANQPQATGNGGNQTQAVAGLNGTNGTQAAAKTAQAQATQAPRPQQMPQAKDVMDQIKVQIAKQGTNGDTIKVQLKPVELGSIEVKLDVAKDGSVSGVVTADNKDTLAMLKNDSRTLEKALSDAGFKTDAGSLTFNLRGEGQQQTAQDQNTSRRSRRAALAAVGGLDATQSGAAAQAQARFAGGRSGVDIQV